MQVKSIDNNTQFGIRIKVNGKARGALMGRWNSDIKYAEGHDIIRRANSIDNKQNPITVEFSTKEGSKRRLAATIKDAGGIYETYTEGWFSGRFFNPKYFLTKVIEYAKKIEKGEIKYE